MVETTTATLTPLQRAFLALEEARARIAALESVAREPIAIIGLGLRAPGGASDADSFWRLLADGVDAIGPVPPGRWSHEDYFDPDPDKPGRIATRFGGFLRDIDQFDARFFNISPREADGMDPQQRLLLTVAWEALEHAGVAPDRLKGERAGVFVGITGSDYAYLQLAADDQRLLDAHFASGIAHSILSGRISYLLGLHGPSLTIDTACSSSLVAIHLAVQSLRSGDCRMALAGGVNLILSPDIFVSLSRARMLAPDGRCKAFAASADGFARAEGCGVLVLKRLSDAHADGDRVLAVIRGSMVNQDGASSSLTAPNGPAQEDVIREALARAGVAPGDVSMLEAHGTGTELGDPIEAKALGAVFGPGRAASSPLLLGSVKSNIGHAEAAAGALGVIKAVLALRNRAVPAHLHFDRPSAHIDWPSLPFKVPTELTPWNPPGRRLAGVSSFGFSGTNAHVVLEEALARQAQPEAERARLLTVSANDTEALAATMRRLAGHLESHPDLALADVMRTLDRGRAAFAHRATVLARTTAEAADALSALADERPVKGGRRSHVVRRDPPRVAFLFTGQGSQYAGMARELYESCRPFRDALDRCAILLQPHLSRPLLDVLNASEPGLIDRTEFTQPALFAIEYALTEAWRSWGVTPSVVIGHSVGEYVAATLAGVLTLPDALRLVATRGRLMQSLPAGGGMAAILAAERDVATAIAASGLPLSIAATNGPDQTVVAGAKSAVEALCATMTNAGCKCSLLPVSHAFHSTLVDPVLPAFEDEAKCTRFSAPKLRLISNLTGRSVSAAQITSPAYWRDHMRQPVRFDAGLRALAETKPDICIEIGPHPALLALAEGVFADRKPLLLASLRKGRPDWEHLLDALAQAHLAGVAIDWRAVDPGGRVIDLPGSSRHEQRHWFHAKPSATGRGRHAEASSLPGRRLPLATGGTIFEATAGADQPAYVRQHQVLGRVVLPATAYLAAISGIAQAIRPGQRFLFEDVSIVEAMLLDDDGRARIVQTTLDPDGTDAFRLRVASREQASDSDWTSHLSGRLLFSAPPTPPSSLAEAAAECTCEIAPAQLYEKFAGLGLQFGESFHTIRSLRSGPSQALGEIALGGGDVDADHQAALALLLDGSLQVAAAAMPGVRGENLHLPVGIGSLALYGEVSGRCFSHVRIRPGDGALVHADVTVLSPEGEVLASLSDVQFRQVDRDALQRLGSRWLEECLYDVVWRPAPVAALPELQLDPAALAAKASAELPALARKSGIEAHDEASAKLESLCVDFAARAIAELGIVLEPGSRLRASGLAERAGVVPRHARLFSRLLAILTQAGMLSRDGDDWQVLRGPRPADLESEARRLLADNPAIAAEIEMTARVAPHLAAALRGERDEADLLFPKGSTDNAERLYRDSPTARLFNGLFAGLAGAIAAARPAGRPLRILEVGGGTGGTTAHVLPRLPQDVSYTFTDIGPMFVARARERHAADGRVEFATLDLERDAAEQGFADRRFDLVIAANVVHATADLKRTLARLRGLLAPGGLVAMLEVTAAQRWFDLTVGLTEGWWSFTDTALRPDYPTLTRAAWQELLPVCGFDAVATLPSQPAQDGALSRQAIFVARAKPTSWLVFEDEAGASAGLTDRLRRRGGSATVVRPGPYAWSGDIAQIDPRSGDDYKRLLDDLAAADRPPDHVVHAWSLDTAPESSPEPASERGVHSVMLLAKALLSSAPAARLSVLTSAAQAVSGHDRNLSPLQAPVWGLGRSLALEHPELRFTCIDVDAASSDAVADELCRDAPERDIALRAGQRSVAELQRWRAPVRPAAAATPWRLVPARPGSIEAFEKVPLKRRGPGAGEVEIAVEATGLNFKDVLNALGLYPGDPGPLGAECAGRVLAVGPGVSHVAPGDDVMAVIGGALASHVVARAELVRRRPAGIGAAEAATFPIAFLTAAFCLDHVARLARGETVLVHAAAGGVGLAAVQIAARAGARIIATAGTPRKRAMLKGLGIEHVFDSRSDAFAGEVLRVTNGRGVDVVLNSLGGDLVEPSFRAIANNGRFVEIGKRGIKSAEWVDALARGIQYDIVDWGETAAREPALIGQLFERLADDLAERRLVSLPRHTFTLETAAEAFRLMAQAGHVGRIVVSHAPSIPALARRDGSYLISGGLTGLGLTVARHLAEKGAGRLLLLGRRDPGAHALQEIQSLRQLGCDVVVATLDVTDEASLAGAVARLRAGGPPLRGVLHAAGVLVNGALVQQTTDSFARVLAPKVDGTLLLDKLTRSDPLDWFVAFSSIAGVLGAAGQANHAAANACLDQLMRRRGAMGLPALSIDWGAWSEVGAAADLTDALGALGIGFLTPQQGLAAFERLLASGTAGAAVLPIDWQRYRTAIGPRAHAALLSHLGRAASKPAEPSQAKRPAQRDFRREVDAAPASRRTRMVSDFVRERLLAALGMDPARPVDPQTAFGDLGLDSLLSVELRNVLGAALGKTFPATLLFDYPTIETLSAFLLGDCWTGERQASAPAEPAPAKDAVAGVEDLSDDEVDCMLRSKYGASV